MTQKFSYHTHTNTLGLFDGRNSIENMIDVAQDKSFLELGISNHFTYHKNVPLTSKMFFNDANKLLDVHKRAKDEILKESQKAKIKILYGLEVDFFADLEWRKEFEIFMQELKPDYLIGSHHFVMDKELPLNFYHHNFEKAPDELLSSYWQNVCEAVKSGYFNFMAHIDLPKLWDFCSSEEWLPYKEKLIQTIIDHKHPVELNTSGWNKCGEQHPAEWMLKALRDGGVPIVISDDAHSTTMLAQHFEKAESLLSTLNYTNRYKIK